MTKKKKKVYLVAGARPNFMKIAPLYNEFKRSYVFDPVIVHTGQHYDQNMSGSFFKDLGLPEPDIYLGAGSGSHAVQTAKVMVEFEKICMESRPDLIVVVGDVNSTLACSVVGAKLGIPIAHVEAGLRSFDRTMPEEINRVITDALSNYLFTTCRDADTNLIKEGASPEKIFFAGNVMIDTLVRLKNESERSNILSNLRLKQKEYALLTLHRPSNVDDKEKFSRIIDILRGIAEKVKIVFPVHPRTLDQIRRFGFSGLLDIVEHIEPLGYLDFLKLMDGARLVLTDSGGIQEETTFLGVPCLTLRENTERPITVEQGTNVVCGLNEEKISIQVDDILSGRIKEGSIPELWDGRAAERIVDILKGGVQSEADPYEKRSDSCR